MEDLEINTLDNAIYMNMKNDISFVFDFYLNFYEHQATVNPNMPLRDLFYVSKVLQNTVKNRAEVVSMSIFEYDEEKHMKCLRQEGFEDGYDKGEEMKLIAQICRKKQKNKTVEQIAEELEETLELVNKICTVVEKAAPEYNEEKIYQMLHEQ